MLQKFTFLLVGLAVMCACGENHLLAKEPFEDNKLETLEDNSEQPEALKQPGETDNWKLNFPEVSPVRPQTQEVKSLILNVSYGMLAYSPAVLSYGKEIFKLPWRFGMQLGPKLIMGGDGFNFELQLKFVYQHFTKKWGDVFGPGFSAGINYGFAYRWMIISTGFGIGASILWGDKVVRVLETVGRVPLKLAWYPKEWFGLTAEVAFLFGLTAVEAENLYHLSSKEKNGSKGVMPGLECNIGFQFP